MIQIEESGMLFEFKEDRVFVIEKSLLHRAVGSGIKSVEFVVSLREHEFAFIEAKSSSPQPTKENKERFDAFIDDVSEKFMHSFNMFLAAILRRYQDEIMPDHFLALDKEKAKFKFILIIKDHQIEWLLPLKEAFSKNLISHRKIWKSSVIVMNEELAKENKLIRA